MHCGLQDQPLGVHQQLSLARTAFLAAIVATDAADPGRLVRLAVEHRHTQLGLASRQDADNLAKHRMHPYPNHLHARQPKIMADRLPERQIIRRQPLGTPTAQHVE
jgi:hypothetical protein